MLSYFNYLNLRRLDGLSLGMYLTYMHVGLDLTLIGPGFFTCLGLGFLPPPPRYLHCLWIYRNAVLYRDWQSKC